MAFIILLKKQDFGGEVYLADWQSPDVPRTLLEYNARRFLTKQGAERAITRLATLFNKSFPNAEILEVKI